MSSIITVDNLGKRYSIRHLVGRPEGGYRRLSEEIVGFAKGSVRALASTLHGAGTTLSKSHQPGEDFWALRNVSFDVKEGEVIGIIGGNGAGKSTLLKLLSRITEPSEGRAILRGRVASLLEVGTGFHPELTGRENIFLNGAILGMSREEIKRQFDEIVEFAEIEQFLDTPVKRYSSGMYVRLAFAVAAHLQTEILVVDEVLAVGDAQFQRKCLTKMEGISSVGRTVLLVTHNMASMQRLCHSSVLLSHGELSVKGAVSDVLHAYLGDIRSENSVVVWSQGREPGDEIVRLSEVAVIGPDGQPSSSLDIRQTIGIRITYSVMSSSMRIIPSLRLSAEDGTIVFVSFEADAESWTAARPSGQWQSTVQIPANFLSEGNFVVTVGVRSLQPEVVHAWAPDCVAFSVIDPMEGDSARMRYAGPIPGVVRPILPWVSSLVRST